jgi:hypothetical protein
MKRTLLESLVDYDLPMLDALARTRGATFSSQQPLAAAKELAPQLLMPASIAIAIADLAPAEREALAALQANGGWIESPRFTRRFGAVRLMGPGRLARERPWESPVNAAEALWYRGLVFRGFRPTADGVVEVHYVPEDLLALLPQSPPADSTVPAVAAIPTPPFTWSAASALVEDIFNILVAVRRRALQLDPAGDLSGHDRRTLNALCAHPSPEDRLSAGDRLDWLLNLCGAAGLTARTTNRLVVNREGARAWLEGTAGGRQQVLYTAWRDDATWNDLHHVPTLRLRATGWRNDPLLARQAVLRALSAHRAMTWYRLDDLVAGIKADDPDFQRPDGDYSTWYIYDLNDQPLIGFEHWDAVEGALIRYLVTQPLFWLGAVDLGSAVDGAEATAFRVSVLGAALIANVAPAEPAPTGAPFIVRDDFSVQVPADAGLYDRFQLARFADYVGREEHTIIYRIVPDGVNMVGKQGVSAAQVGGFLMRVTGQQVPQRVLDALARWQKVGAARLERALLLHLDSSTLLNQLRHDEEIGPLLGEAVGPASVIVPLTNEQRVRRWLTEHGYL